MRLLNIFVEMMLMIFKIAKSVMGKNWVHEDEDGLVALAPRRRLQRSEQ